MVSVEELFEKFVCGCCQNEPDCKNGNDDGHCLIEFKKDLTALIKQEALKMLPEQYGNGIGDRAINIYRDKVLQIISNYTIERSGE